jgi:photosystem II stability/assembly factor-like uncharacterized protein
MPTASIGDIAIDPNNSDVVLTGTGEANIFRSSNAGCGVYKTADGGKTWDKILNINKNTGVYDLVLDPRDPATLYANHGSG